MHFEIEDVALILKVDRSVGEDGCGPYLTLLLGYFLDAHVALGAVLGWVVWAKLEI